MHDENLSIKRAFGSFMTGVTVVTTTDKNNNPVGFTANSFTSVSIDPPLLLVCPGNHLHTFDIFNTTTRFGVSVLAEGQESVSNIFASDPDDRFENVDWHFDEHNTPLIDNCCATFSCEVHQRHIAGDHMVLIGEVKQFNHFDRAGLGYGSSGYFSLSKEQQADTPSQGNSKDIAGAIITYKDQILIAKLDQHSCVPSIEQQGASGARSALQDHFATQNLNIELGPVYSIYDDPNNKKRYTFFLATANDMNAGQLGNFEPLDSLDTSAFKDKAQSIMMSRYKSEVGNNVYGLYVGDTESGDVHHRSS